MSFSYSHTIIPFPLLVYSPGLTIQMFLTPLISLKKKILMFYKLVYFIIPYKMRETLDIPDHLIHFEYEMSSEQFRINFLTFPRNIALNYNRELSYFQGENFFPNDFTSFSLIK